MKQKLRYFIGIALLFISFVEITAQTVLPDEVKIVYAANDKPISQIIKEVSKKSGVNISFQDEIFEEDRAISIVSRGKPLGRLLEEILQGTGVKYRLIGNQIVLVKTSDVIKTKEFTISGFISDAISGERLPFGSVYLHDKSRGATANEFGFYTFKSNGGETHLYFSYIGYKIEIVDFELKEDTEINIQLNPNVQLNEVIVIESSETVESENADVEDISIDELRSSVPLAGEPDVLRMSYMKAGINTGADGFGGMSVRGGSIDQNLIMLDGIPVYNANHALGIFSIFNSDVVKSTKLYKAGFPSRYSGRLSSVLDVITREGNNQEFQTHASVGLISAKAAIEGPLTKGKSSFLLSGRRTYLDPWIGLWSNGINSNASEEGDTDTYFYDINAKVNFDLGKKSKAFISFFNGRDVLNNLSVVTDEDSNLQTQDRRQRDWTFSNTLATARWNWQISNSTFLQSSFYYSRYDFESFNLLRYDAMSLPDSSSITNYRANLYETNIQDVGAKLNIDWLASNNHTFRFGYDLIHHRYRPGLVITDDSRMEIDTDLPIFSSTLSNLVDEARYRGNELRIYVEDQIRLSDRWRLNLGINQAFHTTATRVFAIPEPRISLLYENGGSLIRASYSRLSQFSHLLSNAGFGLPVDVWIPTTDIIEPETAWITALEFHQKLSKSLLFSVEGYYKQLDNIARFNEGSYLRIGDLTNWENNVPVGKGFAYGIETGLEKDLGRWTFGANYTWSKALRVFDDLNLADTFDYRYDRPHFVKFGSVYSINNNVEFSVNWVYGSGNPISLPTDFEEVELPNGKIVTIFNYDQKNGIRLPAYHRMDIGISLFNNYTWGRQKVTFGAYNVYARRNFLYVDIERSFNDAVLFDFRGVYLLSLVPTFSFSLSF